MLWSILRFFFQGQRGTLNLSARDQAMYVNAITRNGKMTNTRSHDDKALSRIAIANRGDVYAGIFSLSLAFSPRDRKVRKLDSSNLQFRRARRPANYIHVAANLTLSTRFKLEAGLKGAGDSGAVTPEGGRLIRVYIRYVISNRT